MAFSIKTDQAKANLERAGKLTKLGAKIMVGAVRRNPGATEFQASCISEYSVCQIQFVEQSTTLVQTLINLAKNPLGIFSLLGGAFNDPYALQREQLKSFCRKYAPSSGVALTEEDIELIN